jgi:collagenase-like PrtC family protease
VLPSPVEESAPAILAELVNLRDLYGIHAATVADVNLANRIREALPSFELTASTLLDVATPIQAVMLANVFDVLVPSSRVLRDRTALAALRQAFPGRIRLIVNEGCLPGCPFRTQHFFEMQARLQHPRSLCTQLLNRRPWLRLTGSWVLPHHLHLYEGLFDELKLDGRATLHHAHDYLRVLRAYVSRSPLRPDEIGAGPASVEAPMEIDEDFFRATLECHRQCHGCSACADYYQARVPPSPAETP